MPLGAILGSSWAAWGRLGAILGGLVDLLGGLGEPLGASWSHLGATLDGLEGLFSGLGRLEAILGPSWAVLGSKAASKKFRNWKTEDCWFEMTATRQGSTRTNHIHNAAQEHFEKPWVLLHVHSKMLTNHWFYCIFAHNC